MLGAGFYSVLSLLITSKVKFRVDKTNFALPKATPSKFTVSCSLPRHFVINTHTNGAYFGAVAAI